MIIGFVGALERGHNLRPKLLQREVVFLMYFQGAKVSPVKHYI
jgi:hypothetical protein